jgi:hypothetical protein
VENGANNGRSGFSGNPVIDAPRLERLATLLAEQFTVLYDNRPRDPLVTVNGSNVAFTFQGGLSGSDEHLLTAGRDREVRDFRENFLRAASSQFDGIVSSLLSADVTFSFAAFDPVSRTTSCFFVLDDSAESGQEQREAILNWSEQVRRNARRLRDEHLRIIERHHVLREALQEAHADSDRA